MPDPTIDLHTLYTEAEQVARTNPLLYSVETQKENADTAYANQLDFWRTAYPAVEIRAIDNPDIDFRLLDKPWSNAWGNPPMVFIQVTPRAKKIPGTSGWLQDVAVFAPIIAAIPIVGTVVSMAISVAAAADGADKMKKFMNAMTSVTNSEFEPQYYPSPFPVLLPLPEAQAARAEPWRLPSIWDRFKHRLAEAQRVAVQAIIGEPSKLTLTADLNPSVTSVTGPGVHAPANDEWLKNLYGAFGIIADPSAQYKQIQTRWTPDEVDRMQAGASMDGSGQDAGGGGGWLAALGLVAAAVLATR